LAAYLIFGTRKVVPEDETLTFTANLASCQLP